MTYGRVFFDNDVGSPAPSDGGTFDVALGDWFVNRLRQLHPEVEQNVRSTVRTIVGTEFTDPELELLTDRALRAAQYRDVQTLTGIQAGAPVEFDAPQGRVVDRIVGGLGQDDLGRRAQDAYRRARKTGQIRVR